MRIKDTIVSLLVLLAATSAQAQITIGGNVYGGGNEGDVGGNTTVTVHAGDLNEVYGGARLADVGGRAFVNIDGAHASDNIIITSVYGGNDIAGTIGSGDALPEELTDVPKANDTEETLATKNAIDNTWNAFIRTSPTPSTATSLVVGSMFGGGNGDYSYTANAEVEGTYNVTIGDKTYTKIYKPELGKTYLEIKGGCIAHLYGGGDNVTVTSNTTICIDNNSPVLDHTNVWTTDPTELAKLAKRMQMSTFQSNLTSYAFNFARVFGGNNKAPMAIRPTWNLKNGTIRDLYSGGNAGAMTYEQGILLVINSDGMNIDNVYGGCRMADVNPDKNDMPKLDGTFNGIECHFPAGYAARLLIAAGNINNVYGGNDISGTVYGGNAVGIHSRVNGDIYGGGNGSYAYTDNKDLKGDPIYGDFYYDVNKILGKADDHVFSGMESAQALNEFRPNAERVSIRLLGKVDNPTIIPGSVYCGGNSATLKNKSAGASASAELKIGSYVIADHVFLGSNGENLIEPDLLKLYKGEVSGKDFSQMDLASPDKVEDKTQFDEYMDAVSISVKPQVVFDTATDGQAYVPYSTKIGSFYCGGNVGSVKTEGVVDIDFAHEVIIFDKLVGGCNNANVDKQFDGEITLNAAYEGGVLGSATNGNKLILNLSGLKLQPKRWNSDKTDLVWNTVSAKTGNEVEPVTDDAVAFDENTDLDRRLKGGNIYGGCYNSGHVDGNVVININETLVERDKIFDVASDEGETLYENVERETYQITKRNTGVILSQQGMDVLGSALNVFGGGFGAPSEIWGSTTINLNKGYAFQVFGGGEMGAIGKKDNEGQYVYDQKYSTYINLNGDASLPGVARGASGDSPDMAECEFIYGGAFEGLIAGDTHINLGNGRIFNSFAGSCNADILGHTETYVGRKKKSDGTYEDGSGFPWIRDHIYGGNDLGGSILGEADFTSRIREDVNSMVADAYKAQVAKATAYIEYTQGRVRNILGGCFGDYDYSLAEYSVKENADDEDYKVANKPYLHSAFVNFRPNTNANNAVEKIFGAGEGFSGDRDGDKSQDHSYVLIDIPDNMEKFANTEVFGAGAYNGLGMSYPAADTFAENFDLNEASAIIDLMRGKIGAAYGGSYEEGVTRRTVVNVPVKGSKKSTIKINNIFGGAYGMKILPPCDVYEANVNYQSGDARVNGAIYGGNNNVRRTLYGKVNISAPVLKDNGNSAKVYGAGRGQYTWSEYTEVNLESGANVWEVYGGGELGNVLNAESVQKYLQLYSAQPADMVANEDEYWGDQNKWEGGTVGGTLKTEYKDEWLEVWKEAWTIGDYYAPTGEFQRYVSNEYTNLSNPLVQPQAMDDRDLRRFTEEQQARTFKRYNTNVLIKEGATVGNYAYGGGYGSATIPLTGGVYGSSYIALLGGTVTKDIYAAGTTGSVCDIFGAGKPGNNNSMGFIATANAYVKGGIVRNVYGGGWEGSVGYHAGEINSSTTADRPGETHVVIGIQEGTSLTMTNGIPVIGRNAYGGGEGGAVYGTANITLNNGYVGYKWSNGYQENIVDETLKDKNGNFIPNTNLETSGNVFGGGYVDNSSVDIANVKIYGGVIRSSVYGGGEIAAVGRGDVYGEDAGASAGSLKGIYKAGQTHVHVYDGWVKRNVFGGGKGLDNLGRTGSLHTNGYVFGQTDVRIHGGEIGTDEGVAQGYGNVFGGGDIGFVYSAFEYPDGSLGLGKKSGTRYDDNEEGYYYKSKGGQFTDSEGTTLTGTASKYMTEDSHVLIEPHCRVTVSNGGTEDNPLPAVTINGHNYFHGDYVPTSDLNTLKDKNTSSATWGCLDVDGIIIHNAIFAGGNVSSGSDQVYANATTLYGNATASIHDIYHRDLITVGTGHTGGLYGDGNLTFVDGYRGLNITNYGTDFYHISDDITLEQYENLTPREAAYYELKYKCVLACTDNEGTTYSVGSTIAQDELIALFAGQTDIVYADGTVNEAYWKKNGVVSKYAGRIMNTIQRADFCGVFGSRMVMKGAQDRVPEIVDYTNYTINRVREVSLNKKESIANDTEAKHKTHGNYFGIYNIVNYLGALTSDVNFYKDVRTTNNTDGAYKADIVIDESTSYGYGTANATYYNWKRAHINDRTRNNGSSHNQVALASGVYLELTTEESTGDGLNEKDWGYITGVVELDLINVQSGVGGGFVYAKNVHGRRSDSGKTNLILTDMNQGAVTNRSFVYSTDDASQMEWQSSGNFVHSTQTIIDDCYDVGGKYKGTDKVPAHYWFIKGQVYVYDQYVSAYTGAPNAYSETVNIPLTITAASHGTMKLLNVQPNRYAYYSTYNGSTQKKLEGDNKVVINDVEYHLNDPISYWDWNLLSKSTERNLFVEDTYVVIADCKIGNNAYAEGTVLLKRDYEALKPNGVKPTNVTQKKMVDGVEQYVPVDFDFVFRSSNNLSHDTGYILTYNVNNPTVWNKYYTLNNGTRDDKITIDAYNNLDLNDQAAYTDGPTYSPIADGLYGQRDYKVSDIITKEVYDTYQAAKNAHSSAIPATQAVFEPAYVVTSYLETVNKDGTEQRLQEGARLCASDYTDTKWSAMSGSVAAAYVCTSTIQLSKTDFIYNGELMSLAQKNALKSQYGELAADIENLVVPAYYCSTAGPYGGNYYEKTKNYRALEAFSSMSAEDREKFTFNYDALDLLIDPNYGGTEGQKYQYDGYSSYSAENASKMIYSLEKQVDYTAIYNGTTETTEGGLVNGKEYSREEYEALPNEQRHYAPISVPRAGDYYVVNTPFIIGETPYSVGTVIESSTYSSLSDDIKSHHVTKLTFTADQVAEGGSTYYYCRESYDGTATVTASNVSGGVSYTSDTVRVGVVIAENIYTQLPNRQKNFSIHGTAPTETSTLFVSRNSDIFDLSKDKIITVIYEYNYEESDESGLHITPVSERHVVNIHLQFKSGIPTVEDITSPTIVLPGTSVTLRTPDVTPGAYEVTGGGWEIFENLSDAESHMNGVDYSPATDPLYWYQDGYYVAYYAQTYLGKTYSNHVPLSVANYHDLKKVMDDKKYHLHVDYDLKRMKRKSKIYINDYTSSSQNGLDLLKDFYNLSVGTSLDGHTSLDSHVRGCNDLEFILHSDIDHSAAWTSLGNTVCFAGNFHGDGHTISGLNNSLFDKLCGNVYNLGVTGSFTGAGIAETGDGYVENCWIKTTGTPVTGTGHYAVFGNPSRSGESNLVQVVNSYYPASNNYTVPTGEALKHGKPIQMADKAFYNGEVAYDLNGFYLYKRYCDQKVSSGNDYLCNYIKSDGTMELLTKHYGTYDNNTALLCSAGYVESRYEDGDFRYADGSIPTTEEKRSYTVTDTNSNEVTRYAPIWPHDYIFFGQSLTYDYTGAHQSHPSTINKRDGLIVDGTGSNHVHRAPAYFGSKAMGVAHFNPVVTLAAYSKPPTETSTDVKEAYPGMTAIDFAGHGDTEYKLGLNGDFFYQPLLDDDGLYSIENASVTRNLLVYAPTEAANKETYDVLNTYFAEPAFSISDDYGSVPVASTTVFGHLVQNNLTTTTDHLLVDKQDFNCPISYTMGSGHRMWYQRTPDKFVNIESGNTKGWDNISLPFKVSYVATQQKGEITHFYKDNTTGHEYWLRQFAGNFRATSTTGVYAADFNLLAPTGENKAYDNKFLWDYYYSKNSNGNAYGDDANGDDYKQYYNTSHTYTSYPLEQAGGAYLIGFPGMSYYEFDLSGEWTAANTATPAPGKLDKQTITFASDPEIRIAISDDEIHAGKTVAGGYAYVANYVSKKFTDAGDCYVLADDGASYVKNTANAIVTAFRPYIVAEANAPARGKDNPDVEQVVFGMDQDTDFLPHDDIIDRLDGTLNIYAKKGKIVVESSLRYTVDVSIYTPAGIAMYKFPVKAGETVEQRINSKGVYIVHSDDGQHMKKVIVR